MNQLTLWSGEPPVNPSPSQGSDKDLQTLAVTSCLFTLASLKVTGLDGLSGKMSPAFCRRTEDGILEPSLGRWSTWGMGSPSGSWTLNGSEWPSAVVVCSLSDTLETQAVPQRFYLSQKACAGILRRAEKRGKKLPELLERALVEVSERKTQTLDT